MGSVTGMPKAVFPLSNAARTWSSGDAGVEVACHEVLPEKLHAVNLRLGASPTLLAVISMARISSVFLSTPKWTLRHRRRFPPPCLRACRSSGKTVPRGLLKKSVLADSIGFAGFEGVGMLGVKDRDQLKLFVAGSLRDLLPDDHVLVRVDRVLDLDWLRIEVRGCCKRMLNLAFPFFFADCATGQCLFQT